MNEPGTATLQPTDTSTRTSRTDLEEDNDRQDSDGQDSDEQDSDGQGTDRQDSQEEVESVEKDEEETEMTFEEKKIMYEAVKSGDFETLDVCLDKPNCDLNMIWYKENLLMAAVRERQTDMAEFLLDNGVDPKYSTIVMEMRATARGIRVDRYELTCRQMAYDYGLLDIVQLIDHLQGNLFPFINPPERAPRLRRLRTSVNSSSECSGRYQESVPESDRSSGKNSRKMSITREDREEKSQDVQKNSPCETFGPETALASFAGPGDKQANKAKKKGKETREDIHCRGTKLVEDEEKGNTQDISSQNKGDHLKRNNLRLKISGPRAGRSHDNGSSAALDPSDAHDSFRKTNLEHLVLRKAKMAVTKQKVDVFSRGAPSATPAYTSTPPWKTQPRNRIWSSKSALAARKAISYRCLSGVNIQMKSRSVKENKATKVESDDKGNLNLHNNTQPYFRPAEITKTVSVPPPAPISHLPDVGFRGRDLCLSSTSNLRSSSPTAADTNGTIKSSLTVSDQTAWTTKLADTAHFKKYKTVKRGLIPSFRNSYQVLEFIPDIKASLTV